MDINFNISLVSNLIDECGFAFKAPFTPDMGLNIHYQNFHTEPKRTWKHSKRFAIIDITTWAGMCAGAKHYYCKLKVEGVCVVDDNNPKKIVMRDEITEKYPESQYTYSFNLSRILTNKDIENDTDDRYLYFSPGDYVENFDTIEEIISLAKDIKNNLFVGDWDFFVKFPYSDELVNLNEF